MGSGSEPISDDELLYRRVPIRWYDPSTGRPFDEAFAPHKENDLTGLSVSRAKYKSIEQAARGMPGKRYYVATLRAGDLRGSLPCVGLQNQRFSEAWAFCFVQGLLRDFLTRAGGWWTMLPSALCRWRK